MDPVAFVLERLKPTTEASDWLLDLKLRNHGALTALMTGQANRQHVTDAISANNMCAALIARGFGTEYRWVLEASNAAIQSFCERYERTGKYGLNGQEINAMRDLLTLHDQQMEVTRIGDVEDAIKFAKQLTDRNLKQYNLLKLP